ncbi:MAG: BMP family protein [Anaerolineaceae bacterium]|nr:BMP family protein [Anaerolineaceae bacterium]
MFKSMKFRVFIVGLVLMLMLTACGGQQVSQPTEAPAVETKAPAVEAPTAAPTVEVKAEDTPEPVVEKKSADGAKIALLTLGTINDGGWNSSIYEGLLAIEKEYGFESTLAEKINYPDMEEVVRTYADAGYAIIIGHANNFLDIFYRVAPEYPDITFICTSGLSFQEPNVLSISADSMEQGFLAGAVAGLMTKTGKVAFVSGQESLPTTKTSHGFKMGAEYVNPDVEATTVLTGNNADPVRMNEATNSLVDNGVDIVFTSGNAVARGTLQAAEKRGILAIGNNTDQNNLAPNTVLVSIIKDHTLLMKEVAERYLNDNLKAEYVNMNASKGAVYLSPWHGFEDKVPQEVKDKLDEVMEELKSGKIDLEAMEKELKE